jgi:hypothetical protein
VEKERKDYMKKIITILLPALILLVSGLLSTSCGALKEVPVQTIEKIVYRDSLIYVKDTLTVPVPYEKVVEVIPDIDTSYLETSVAKSLAYLDTTKRKLHHTLEQKGTIKYIHDTVHVVEYIDRIVEKEVPVEIEVVKYKRDSLFWVLVGWALLCVAYAIIKIFLVK